ncbi:Cna B-type domain-containing protein, partial [Vagococcus fluvialis]|uniref:Cna B-type domain-containing protein n=1 Tax=Vagococcus fluvialis TaxID=2738 RepID=UPI003B2200A8
TVNLLADGQKVDTIELNEGNDWKHTFTDLPVVHDITDEEAIKYTVEEIDVDGYETSIAGSAALGFVITNTEDTPLTPIEPGTTSVDVSKEWIGEKQDSVTVNLLADGQKVDTIELNEGNDWKHTFTDLPVVHDITDEEAINYTVEEVTVDGYKTSIAGSAALGFVITNTEDTPLTPIEPGTTSVDVSKEWIGEKQDSVTVNLLADGQKVDTIELNEGNDWKHTFTDLPVVHDITDEEAIKYTVEEIDVDGYETSIAGSAALGFVITNTEDTPLTPIEPGTTSVDVSKEWIGEKQDSVTVNLLADGQKVDTIELNEGNDWKHTFTDLPVVHDITDEEAIKYTVEEIDVDGYETSIAGSAALGFVITNTEDTPLTPIEPGTTSVDVSKEWIGEKQDSVT